MDFPIVGVKKKDRSLEELLHMDEEGEEVINVGDMVDFVYGAAAFASTVKDDINPDDAFLYHYAKK